jgi:hypothetical protein
MPATNHCSRCGAELGPGRFCTHCGEPVATAAGSLHDWRTDTAERPRVTAAPVEPSPASPPESARFPLFADDTGETTRVLSAPAYDVVPDDAEPETTARHTPWLPWAVGFAVMALVAGLGAFLLLSGGGGRETASDPAPTEPEPRERRGDRSPDPTPEQTTDPEPAPEGPTDLARFAGIAAPEPAPPSQDNSGNVVRYDVAQLVDGVPETTWRTPGDATGATITLTFDEPTVLSEVGLINGYAKVGQDAQGPLDWYHGNRRVLAVEWTFEDGTVRTQRLADTTIMQTVSVPQVETTTVGLRLLKVSPPGPGRASRDYTAISDVRLFGHTA